MAVAATQSKSMNHRSRAQRVLRALAEGEREAAARLRWHPQTESNTGLPQYVCVCVCQQECAAANANAKSKWESADTVRESPRKEATRALSLSRVRSLVVCGRIGIHTHKTHHNHAPLGQRRCRRRLGAAAAEQRRIQLPQSKERAPRIFLLYFKLLMSGLFSY